MNRPAWKNRLTLGLGVGIATIALVAGCGDDEDGDDAGIDTGTDITATETMEATETTEATEDATEDATEEATEDATETATATEDGATEGEDVTLTISAGSVMMDGAATQEVALTAGSTVTFENAGEAAVAIATDDGTIDEEVEAGASTEHTFDEAGTWTLTVDGMDAATITVE